MEVYSSSSYSPSSLSLGCGEVEDEMVGTGNGGGGESGGYREGGYGEGGYGEGGYGEGRYEKQGG